MSADSDFERDWLLTLVREPDKVTSNDFETVCHWYRWNIGGGDIIHLGAYGESETWKLEVPMPFRFASGLSEIAEKFRDPEFRAKYGLDREKPDGR